METLCLYKYGYFHREADYGLRNSTAIVECLRYYHETLLPFMKVRFMFDSTHLGSGDDRIDAIRENVKKILIQCKNKVLYDILFKSVGSIL